MTIGIIGAGRWGSTLANIFCQHTPVVQWGAPSPHWEKISQQQGNDHLRLKNDVKKTEDLNILLAADIILLVIPAQELRNFVRANLKKRQLNGKNFIICIKGLEKDTGQRMSEILQEELSDQQINIFSFSGPAQPQDILLGIPTNMVLAGPKNLLENIGEQMKNDTICIHLNTDIIGCEIGAAAKNVTGIMAGILDGLGRQALKGTLMTQSLIEVGQIITAAGGRAETAAGLSYLGDFEATLFSQWSHNRLYGEQLATNKVQDNDKTVEGIFNAQAFKILDDKYSLSIPIFEAAESILFGGAPIDKTIDKLFRTLPLWEKE